MPYKVLIFPSLKFGCSTTSANPWINFAGHMGETGIIEVPKGILEFSVEVCYNLSRYVRKPVFELSDLPGCPTRLDTNRPVQSQKQGRSLKFRM